MQKLFVDGLFFTGTIRILPNPRTHRMWSSFAHFLDAVDFSLMPPKRKVADVGDDKSSPTDLTGASSFSDKEKEQSIEAKKNPEYMDPEKYKVYPNYTEFKNNTHVTTISKLIADHKYIE